MPIEPTERRLDDWRRRLIDLTRRNRLLHYKPNKSTSLGVLGMDGPAVFEALAVQRKALGIWLPPEDDQRTSSGLKGSKSIVPVAAESNARSTSLAVVGNSRGGASIHRGTGFHLRRMQRRVLEADQPVPLRWAEHFDYLHPNRKDLERSLLQLQRRERSDYRERGIRVLHITLGVLIWREQGDSRPIISPLLMCPVKLDSTEESPFRVVPVDEEIVVNPALSVKLRSDFRIEFPEPPEEWDGDTIAGFLDSVADIASPRQWVVEKTSLLDLFTFHKLVMYHDLSRNAGAITGHTLVRTLVGEQPFGDAIDLGPPPSEKEIDNLQHPERTFQVLDADSSQQACIQAVLDGHNIVLQGPPGTGKSQTIANVIAEMVARGRTVLFVSEKMAALEVVSKRLREAGLGDLSLEAHSRLASKKEVISSLKAALDHDLNGGQKPSPGEFEQLLSLRQSLNEYVLALHERRSPFERSLFEVLGTLSRLYHVQAYPLSTAEIAAMTPGGFSGWERHLEEMSELWWVAQEGIKHPWWGCRVKDNTFEDRERWRGRLSSLQEALSVLGLLRADVVAVVGGAVPDSFQEIEALVRLAEHLDRKPLCDEVLIASDGIDSLLSDMEALSEQASTYKRLIEGWERRNSFSSWKLNAGDAASIEASWKAAENCLCRVDSEGKALLGSVDELFELAKLAETFGISAADTQVELEREFGLPNFDRKASRTEALARIAQLSAKAEALEIAWFNDEHRQRSRELVNDLRPVCADYWRRVWFLSDRYGKDFTALEFQALLPNAEKWAADSESGTLDSWDIREAVQFWHPLAPFSQSCQSVAAYVSILEREAQCMSEIIGWSLDRLTIENIKQMSGMATTILSAPPSLPASWNKATFLNQLREATAAAQLMANEVIAARGHVEARLSSEVYGSKIAALKTAVSGFISRPEQTTFFAVGEILESWFKLERTVTPEQQGFSILHANLVSHIEKVCDTLEFDWKVQTPDSISNLDKLAGLTASPNLPEANWLDTSQLEARVRIVRAAMVRISEFNARRLDFLERYDQSIFELDLDGLCKRFASASHRPPLCWVHPRFKADRAQLLSSKRHKEGPLFVLQDMVEAKELVRIGQGIHDTYPKLRKVLGRYFAEEETNFEAALSALEVARLAGLFMKGALQSAAIQEILTGRRIEPPILREVSGYYTQLAAEWIVAAKGVALQFPAAELAAAQQAIDLENRYTELVRPFEEVLGSHYGGLDTDWVTLKVNLDYLALVFQQTGNSCEALPNPVASLVFSSRDGSPEVKALRDCSASLISALQIWDAQSSLWFDRIPMDGLLQGLACAEIRQELLSQTNKLDAFLGSHSSGLETDFAIAERALVVAEAIVSAWQNQFGPGESPDDVRFPEELSRFLSESPAPGSPRSPKLTSAGARFERAKAEWEHRVTSLEPHIPPRLNPNRPEWGELAWEELANWGRGCQEPISRLRKYVAAASSKSHIPPVDIATLYQDCLIWEQIQLMDSSWQACDGENRARFGTLYSGVNTPWDALQGILLWLQKLHVLVGTRGLSSKLRHFAMLEPKAILRSAELRGAFDSLTAIVEDIRAQFESPNDLPGDTFEGWRSKERQLTERFVDWQTWSDFSKKRSALAATPLGGVLTQLIARPPDKGQVVDAFRKSIFLNWVDGIFATDGRLTDFRGLGHEKLIERFRDLDRRLIRLSAGRIAEGYSSRKPRVVNFGGPESEIALLRREAAKKSRHLPLSQLFAKLPNLLGLLKPCIMMSPLTVSQYLPANPRHFDLVVFDEASQIHTEDAVGSLYRGKQLLVAGDSKQLPPSDFFSGIDNEEDIPDDEEGDLASDFKSLLDECGARFDPKYLRWHYRSRHESLISFSNHRYYGDRLFTFPSAKEEGEDLGVELEFVPDGIYDRGRTKKNIREAKVVVERVFRHFARFPEKSVGVVTFSRPQAEAIEDEIALERKLRPEFETYFSNEDDRLDGFFVKNLENVQGDERDCIIFSVGYGRDSTGVFHMNFGPLTSAGGERRLNVAVTRARDKIILVSSVLALDFNVEKLIQPGALNLYRYLDFAERGRNALEITDARGGETETPFEDEVAEAVRGLGYNVAPQVGCSGYRIDLGVRHPDQPGRFILGIECDGAMYHSSATTRDRDRLRQEILESLGWQIHRIWSPEWVRARDREVSRLKGALEASRKNHIFTHIPVIKDIPGHSRGALEKIHVGGVEDVLPGTSEYRAYVDGSVPGFLEGSFLTDGFAKQESRLHYVVQLEGPVHSDLLMRRLIVGARVTSEVTEIFKQCLRRCQTRRLVEQRGDFVWVHAQGKLLVRFPSPAVPSTSRTVEQIASEELREGMIIVLIHAAGQNHESLVRDTARLFGWNRVGDKIKNRLEFELDNLVRQGRIREVSGTFSVMPGGEGKT